jgi:Fur family ferric uptake transcriptional regulator
MLRMTKQRSIILEELRKVSTHPTADELYAMVRKRLPRISLGTVYRNLEILSKAAVIRTLNLAGTPRRFDGCIEDHCHVRCTRCGEVEDIDITPPGHMDAQAARKSTYRVMGHHMEFAGMCPRCEGKTKPPEPGQGG